MFALPQYWQVVATVERKLWCFPKTSKTIVLPRFKIVDTAFTYGPRSIHWIVYPLFLTGLIMVLTGMAGGGCRRYYGYYFNSSSCATVAIGFLLLLIFAPLLVFIPCCFKK